MNPSAIRFSRLTIRRKIFLGFSVICLLLVLLGSITLVTFVHMNTSIRKFIQLTEQSNTLMEIDQSAAHIQRNVIRFMHEGYDSAGMAALDRMNDLHRTVGDAIDAHPGEGDLAQSLREIRGRLGTYEETFREAMEEKQIYIRLVSEQLPLLNDELIQLISRADSESAVNPRETEYLLALSRARSGYLSYFESLQADHAIQAEARIAQLKSMLHDDIRGGQATGDMGIHGILDRIVIYEKVAHRAIQATRGYLYLINVVMSGEAAEVQYLTRMLWNQAQASKQGLHSEMEREFRFVRVFIIGTSGLIVAVGLVLGLVIAHQSTAPLLAITSTLKALAKGGRVKHIPGMNRKDEIGELAEAANVFRERNARTESMAQELAEKGKDLEASNAELEQFVYTVSHDLKSPLVTSMGFVGIMREMGAAGQVQEAFSKLDRIENANRRMAKLIEDLLDLSRVGRIDTDLEDIDTDALLQGLREEMAPVLKEHAFSLILKGPFPVVHANESRVLEVFENILSNAAKYGKSTSGQENRVVISCRLDTQSKRHVFQIRDFGQGIPAPFREKVFGLFTRLDSSQKGTGIGLAIVRKLMHLFKGEVWIEDADGEGALFCAAFPVNPGYKTRSQSDGC